MGFLNRNYSKWRYKSLALDFFFFFLNFRLILGMMLTTSFLSMWLSNTASTAMMLPIATAILKSLFGDKEVRQKETQENQGRSDELYSGLLTSFMTK